jgi:hypothetical protein
MCSDSSKFIRSFFDFFDLFYAVPAFLSPKSLNSTRYRPFPCSDGIALFFLVICKAIIREAFAFLSSRRYVYGVGGREREEGIKWIPNYQFYNFLMEELPCRHS